MTDNPLEGPPIACPCCGKAMPCYLTLCNTCWRKAIKAPHMDYWIYINAKGYAEAKALGLTK